MVGTNSSWPHQRRQEKPALEAIAGVLDNRRVADMQRHGLEIGDGRRLPQEGVRLVEQPAEQHPLRHLHLRIVMLL